MGNYNPHAPQILGQEWVPIRDEDAIFSPAVNSVELGHRFVTAGPNTLTTARFYINELQPASDRGQTFMASIYPIGTEDQSGPVSSLLIPVNAVVGTNATASGAATLADCLLTQSSASGVVLNTAAADTGIAMSFGVSTYYPVLNGKRILGVNLLSGTAASDDIVGPTRIVSTSRIVMATNTTINSVADPQALFGRLRLANEIDRSPFGEINQFWTANSPQLIADRVPWTYAQLTRLDAVATQLYTKVETGTNRGTTANSNCYIFYAALEVIYCEEKRVAVGATQFGTTNSSHSFGADSVLGTNQIIMHDMAGALNPVLAAGDYILTISSADVGGLNDNLAQTTSDYPNLNAVRELYTISPHPGSQINLPFPLVDRVGDVFTSELTHVLPQISLHTSAGPMTEPHVYGRQAAAQVYGTNTASQGIYDGAGGAVASYPQVRYYARRFGDTTVPLTLGGCTTGGMLLPGVQSANASTPDNAALDIVGDIDLRIDLTASDWSAGFQFQDLISKWSTSAGNNISYRLGLNPNRTLQLAWSTTGAAGGVLFDSSTVAATPGICGRLAVRAFLDVNNGAAGHTTTFYTAPTSAGPYVQLGAPVVTAGVTSIFSGAAILQIGVDDDGSPEPLSGIVHNAQVINSVGTQVANPDFEAQTPGTTSFADAAGRTWTLNGTATIIDGNDASSASITPANFDQLAEILDGWREVTLRFTTAPTMGGSAGVLPVYTWSAAAETSGNRWEILAASAPAVSGIPANLYNLVPAPNQLGIATYQPPVGAQVELNWMPQGVASPWVSSPTLDPATDAVLILSQDPPTVTGLALTARTQTVTGFGLDCGALPCCIPTGIAYQQLTWASPPVSGTGLNALSLPGTVGNYASTPDNAALDIVGDIDIRFDASLNWRPSAAGVMVAKFTAAPNLSYQFFLNPDGTINITWSANGTALIAKGSTVPVPVTSGRLAVRVTLDVDNGAAGNTVTFYTAGSMAGPWVQLGAPVITAGVTSIFSGTSILEIGTNTAGTSAPLAGLIYSAQVLNGINGTAAANPNFSAQAIGTTSFVDAAGRTWTLNGTAAIVGTVTFLNLASLELQRYDSVAGAFQTIMRSTSLATTSFNDYEARVGLASVYRIRALNALNFAGAWSSQVTGSVPTPGVTGGCADSTGALIFTSNANQSGANNAAYVMQWDNAPVEDFKLPEADMVQYQPMYGRDGSVAFHGTERGLESFDRTVLINAAAIDPVRLADAKTIRDLAWANLPYVCVRDEIGDRWFASVQIPTVNAQLNRTKYFARVEIIEVTQTPYAVNP